MAGSDAVDGTEEFAHVNAVRLCYQVSGEGPVVVLTHGLGGNLESWQPTAEALQDRFTVLRWDVRGFGRSDRERGPVDPKTWAADLNGVLEHAGVDRAVLVGISLGGVVAQRFALDFPERTRALVLMSTTSEVGDRARTAWLERARLVEEKGLLAAFGGGPALSYAPDYAEKYAAEIRAAAEESARRNDPHCYAAAARAVSAYDFTAELARLDLRALVLQGLEDRLTPPGGGVILARAIPGARLELIEGCGHAISAEKFETMLALLEDFLAELPG